MTYFHNAVCPVCEQPLTETDDVVVCPECGAPYHRACYKKAGRCLYAEKHGAGFSYLPETGETEEQQFVLCPHCGKGNPVDAAVCGNCGAPLPQQPTEDEPPAPPKDTAPNPTPAYRRTRAEVSPDTGKFRPVEDDSLHLTLDDENDPMGQVRAQLKEGDTLDGFTVPEWLAYLGPSGPVYLFQFKQMDSNRSGRSFSLSAMLFAPLYFLYRKMWGWGIVALLCRLVCGLPDALLTLYEAGALQIPGLSLSLLNKASVGALYLGLALNIFWGIAASTLYRRQCVRRMGRIKLQYAQQPPAEDDADGSGLYRLLARQGGVSMTAAIIIAVVLAASALFSLVWMLPAA